MTASDKIVLSKTEDILTRFFTAWQNENWTSMGEACQPSWRKFIHEPVVDRLIAWFGEKKLTAFYLYGGEDLTEQMNLDIEKAKQTIRFEALYKVKSSIEYMFNSQKYRARIYVSVISEDGNLGVNPSSVLREIRQ